MRFLWLMAVLCAASFPADAATIKYYQDPVYKQLNDSDPHPMSDLLSLAKGGDARAQFILGDLYAKGKGGLVKSAKQARTWFETSAMNGYSPSFIRLGALARREKNNVLAWQWYALGAEHGRSEDRKYAASARDALQKDAAMTAADIALARKGVADWKKQRAKGQQARAEKEKLEERRAAVLERAEQKAAEQKSGSRKQETRQPPHTKPEEKKTEDTAQKKTQEKIND
jgi:hypothetical protein